MDDTKKVLKKNICFLFTGELRKNSLGIKNNTDNRIINSYKEYVFTDKFKEKYNYKIFISCDNINIDKTINFFDKKFIGNIHTLDNDYYYYPISQKINNIDFYKNKYKNNNFNNCIIYPRSIDQQYKILDAYNLYKVQQLNFDFIIKVRLDTVFNHDVCEKINKLENNKDLQIIMQWDKYAIGKPDIMRCYCNGLNNNYGKYKYLTPVIKNPSICINYHEMCKKIWTYSPERQLFEQLFEFCNMNNYDINISIESLDCKFIYNLK